MSKKRAIAYPSAKKSPTVKEFHGEQLVDEYEWLRDKSAREVTEFLTKQNELTDQITAPLTDLKEQIFTEIKSRVQETDLSVPTKIDNYWYFVRTKTGAQYPIHCRVAVDDTTQDLPPQLTAEQPLPGEEVILDQNKLAADFEYFSLGALTVSKDGKQMFYALDTQGDERYAVYQQTLGSESPAKLLVADTAGSLTLSPAGDKLFYTTVDETWRPDTLWCYYLDSSHPVTKVFTEKDTRFWLAFGLTRSEKYYLLSLSSKVTSEVRYLPVTDTDINNFKIVTPRQANLEYHVEHAVIDNKDYFLKVTNENAINYQVQLAAVDAAGNLEKFNTFISSKADVRVETIDAFADYLVLSYREQAVNKLAILNLTQAKAREDNFTPLPLESALHTVELLGNHEWSTRSLRIMEASYITPTKIISYNPQTEEKVLLKEQIVLGNYQVADYEQIREWVVAKDGTKIPISIVKRKDVAYPAPTLQYGYGSYEISLDPSFSASRLSLLDRGIIYVEAHVRGGGELGRNWYETGKELQKWNTFTDFMAVSKYLLASKITKVDGLVAEGGSAGGLLMGVVANEAPELYAGILAVVPFVDPLTSITNPELPLTVIEWDEWGNPLQEKAVFDYIKSYAPYHNVKEQAYPAILAITSLNDTRVLYVEPAKWIAKLQQATTSTKPILLKTEMIAGHGGVSGRYKQWEETAFELAWIIQQANSKI